MSLVVEENRKLREELEQFRKTNAEQSDKLLAYETYVSSAIVHLHVVCQARVCMYTVHCIPYGRKFHMVQTFAVFVGEPTTAKMKTVKVVTYSPVVTTLHFMCLSQKNK